jgi:hypothetical protein
MSETILGGEAAAATQHVNSVTFKTLMDQPRKCLTPSFTNVNATYETNQKTAVLELSEGNFLKARLLRFNHL